MDKKQTEDYFRRSVAQTWDESFHKEKYEKLTKSEAKQFLRTTLNELTGKEKSEAALDKFYSVMKDGKSEEVDQESAVKFLIGFHAGEKFKICISKGQKPGKLI